MTRADQADVVKELGALCVQLNRNPFRAWLAEQARTQTSVALELGVDRSYVSDLMSEKSELFPSLQLAFKIETFTKGKVTARAMHDFARLNQRIRKEYKDAR